MQPHKIVSQAEWLKARNAHLAKEKEFTRARDELARQRRELPWVEGREGLCVRRAATARRRSPTYSPAAAS